MLVPIMADQTALNKFPLPIPLEDRLGNPYAFYETQPKTTQPYTKHNIKDELRNYFAQQQPEKTRITQLPGKLATRALDIAVAGVFGLILKSMGGKKLLQEAGAQAYQTQPSNVSWRDGIYTQPRIGKEAKPFDITKIITMEQGAENALEAQRTGTGELQGTIGYENSYITPIGEKLRRTHTDELPQGWNILKKQMRAAGVRPYEPIILANVANAYGLPTAAKLVQRKPGAFDGLQRNQNNIDGYKRLLREIDLVNRLEKKPFRTSLQVVWNDGMYCVKQLIQTIRQDQAAFQDHGQKLLQHAYE